MFSERNTVEQIVFDTLCDGATANLIGEERAGYGGKPTYWRSVSPDTLLRQHSDVLVKSTLPDALIRPDPANAQREAAG